MTHTTFEAFRLAAPIAKGLRAHGFETPTPIQAKALAPQLAGRDLLGLAETGSGKTAAFVLPILQGLVQRRRPAAKTVRALILSPTRELAVQILETAKALAGAMPLSTLLVVGGTSRPAQVRAAARGVDILVATPGRLNDLIASKEVDLSATEYLVLDEADRMLDMGFIKPVRDIVRHLPTARRTALFSATMPADVEGLAASLLTDPVRVEVTRPGETVSTIEETVELVETADKRARLAAILAGEGVGRSIVFARTKRGADRVAQNLAKDGIAAHALHGNKSQNARQKALDAFKSGAVRVLVATDIASRGIDVKDITHVVQFDLPDEPEVYVHRVGRTGRNGATGQAIALCSPQERDKLRAVEKLTRKSLTGGPNGQPSDDRQARTPRKGATKSPQRELPSDTGSDAVRPRRRRRRTSRKPVAVAA